MKSTEKRQRPEGGRPSWLDPDSARLLERFTTHRMRSKPKPMASTVRTECAVLRTLLRAAQALGGPKGLRGLVGRPELIIRVLRGDPPRSHIALLGMRLAVTRLLDVVLDAEDAAAMRGRITEGLIHRPQRGAPSHFTARTVGGFNGIVSPRPVLVLNDLERLIGVAGRVLAGERFVERNRALLALLCFSGLTLPEIVRVEHEKIELVDGSEGHPWCAFVHGLSRGRRAFSLPIHVRARSYLETLHGDVSEGRRDRVKAIFRSGERHERPLSYTHAARIVHAVLRAAGIPGDGRVVFRRAYVALLKQEGISDFAIRDAIGVRHMETVDILLRASRGRAAQAVAAEHNVLGAPLLRAVPGGPFQQVLPLDEPVVQVGGPSRMLGIDPAYRCTGWALVICDGLKPEVAGAGVIDTKRMPQVASLQMIEHEFQEVLRHWRPDRVLLEAPGRWVHRRSSSRRSIEALAMARGIMLKVCAADGVAVEEVDVGQVRQALIGRANASKADVADCLQALGIKVPVGRTGMADPDIADAIAVALWGHQQRASQGERP